MPFTSKRIIASGPHREGNTAQAERLLEHMQRIHNHDLPNQIVALQSLLQLLSFEEARNLSEDGREYVRRLQNAARRASELVRFLKDIGRLTSFQCKSETITLASLARELQGELQRQFPEIQFTFDWQWNVPAILGDPRVYLHAIVELCKALLVGHANPCTMRANSRQNGNAVELAFQIVEPPAASDATVTAGVNWSERMEVILAREWLALCGAEAQITLKNESNAAFLITVRV